jgi:hypothetical protein
LLRDARIYAWCIAELLGNPLLPLDFRLTVEELKEGLLHWEKVIRGDFDLGAVRSRLENLRQP